MNRENYEILQVSEFASDEEVRASYERLKNKYNEEKWLDGEAGNHAARMLTKLEAAYAEVMEERRERRRDSSGPSAFDAVADSIRRGDIAEAQRLLDNFNERSAEWHYLQSVVFYKKSWMNESKKQLEIAMSMDPSNSKYRDAYDKLNSRTRYEEQAASSPTMSANPSSGGEQMGGNWCANCASMCYTFLCVNCLFNLCCRCR